MNGQTKEQLVNGGVAALRVGTPSLLAWILYELMQMNQKLDLLLQLIAAGRR